MGRKLAIETHPQRHEIEQMLLNKVPVSHISEQFGVSRGAIARFRDSFEGSFKAIATKRSELLTKSVDDLEEFQEDLRGAESIWNTLKRITQRAWMVLDACHAYLQDPDDPGKYDLGPRGEDITVVLTEYDDEGKLQKEKRKLSDVIAEIEGTGKNVAEINYKIADPRKLILDTANTLNKQLELIARLQGELQDVTVNITQTSEWKEIQTTILQVTKDYPEVREKIASAFTAGDAPADVN
ncbi:hypothetical protein [Sediminispirochaeta smaragdinae]|uniref:Uncharacterized protein n=1 Tax=Sediminispirochaeta smaragdinae (strain DSM 11293 / JCM 15392 / SEBR 4228) TaxID=573413 RepID=E1R215_SEDSS|nr:hypothetical protein [Sediminispirochaeta smaragdinae]ADK81900.1 hypothetical protein Spirs_2797 [Sediminispirochaeta smaragdinae DSM 11293]